MNYAAVGKTAYAVSRRVSCVAVVVCWAAATGVAQQEQFKRTFVSSFGAVHTASPTDGVLYEPVSPGPKSRIAILFYGGLKHFSGPELSKRGYRVLTLQHSGFDDPIGFEGDAPFISEGVKYLRSVPGVEKVVLIGHSGTSSQMAFYQNLAENGPRVCQGPEKLYPCQGKNLSGLAKADGLIMLDNHAGNAFARLTYADPAIADDSRPKLRDAELDMFNPRNGYDAKTRTAKYSEAFLSRFFAAQAAKNEKRIAAALARLKAIEAGTGDYTNDEPFIAPGGGERPLSADLRLLSRTKAPHPLLKADGTIKEQIVHSVRGSSASDRGLGSYQAPTSVRRFLASNAIRTTKDYKMTEDSITGVDWKSSSTASPSNVEGITVPLLIVAGSCHYWLVTDEIIYDHAASKDKQYVIVEGASHVFSPCKPEYGDTQKRLFGYVDTWLSAPGRFSPASK